MGLLQANEVLKVLLGIGDPLVGRLLLFDALEASFTELKLRRDPACPTCSDAAVAARVVGVSAPAAGGSAPASDGLAATEAAPATGGEAPATEALRFPFPGPTREVPT
jgi:hypothetical protein